MDDRIIYFLLRCHETGTLTKSGVVTHYIEVQTPTFTDSSASDYFGELPIELNHNTKLTDHFKMIATFAAAAGQGSRSSAATGKNLNAISSKKAPLSLHTPEIWCATMLVG
jgi:hypothetical protein